MLGHEHEEKPANEGRWVADRPGQNRRRSGPTFRRYFGTRRASRRLPKLRPMAQCDLRRSSAGGTRPRIMMIGEQPGDEEDKKGLLFVGPAGRLLDRLLLEAGVD